MSATLLDNLRFGLDAGSAYALLALGLVLVHAASGLVNFAHGVCAAASVYAALAAERAGAPAAAALLAALAVGVVAELGVRAVVSRVGAVPHGGLVATLALLFVGEGLLQLAFGAQPLAAPRALPAGLALPAALVATVLLQVGLHKTRRGLELRAVASRPAAAARRGVDVRRVTRLAWALAGLLAALAGLVAAPRTLVEPAMASPLLLRAFAAATLGGWRTPWGALLGGWALGAGEALLGAYVATALQESLAFAVLLLALVTRGQGLLDPRTERAR